MIASTRRTRLSRSEMKGIDVFTDQSPFAVRFEWGGRGLDAVVAGCRVVVIVDVFSFCTAVDVATGRGAAVIPYGMGDDTAARHARECGAILASEYRTTGGYSLSPTSLVGITPGTRLVLPSRNGATLSLRVAGRATTLAACLRNASAVSRFAASQGGPVAVIGGGERWPDESLRPAWEDLVGAGAVIAGLPGPRSPEAQAACDAFRCAEPDLPGRMRDCSSGRELAERGFATDVDLAAAIEASRCVPALSGEAFIDVSMSM